jgi:argininosuccinate lyase
VIGDVVALLTLLKGLPLAYNRDLQEDKESLFDAVDTTQATLRVLTEVIAVLQFDEATLRRAASDPSLLATDIAEYLVRRGVPFREAHQIVGTLVRQSDAEGRTLADLSVAEWRAASPVFEPDIVALFDVDSAPQRRITAGGPAPNSVSHHIAAARARLERAGAELDHLR